MDYLDDTDLLSALLFAMVRNACLNYLKHLCIVENHRLEFLAGVEGEERLYCFIYVKVRLQSYEGYTFYASISHEIL